MVGCEFDDMIGERSDSVSFENGDDVNGELLDSWWLLSAFDRCRYEG
jgi:hypothetical protein